MTAALWLSAGVAAITSGLAVAQADVDVLPGTDTPVVDAPVDDKGERPFWPADGERLRTLADRLDIDIGWASFHEWPQIEEAADYTRIAAGEYNILTPENSMKWELVHPLQDEYDFVELDRLRDFAVQNGMALHGHPLVWYNQVPPWYLKLTDAEREAAMLEHIATVVDRYRGQIRVWDVVNEALDDTGRGLRVKNNPYYAAMGVEFIDKAFAAARAADPAAELLYNDFDIGWLNRKSNLLYELIKELQLRNVPIDGVGFQMHIKDFFNESEGFSTNLQRFADLGLSVYITELDVGLQDRGANTFIQAGLYKDIVQRCLMQPACKAVQLWGLNDKYSWRPFSDPLPFDDNFRIKPAYYGLQEALRSRPVHPEQCELNGFTVDAGTVRLDGNVPGANLRCANVNLDDGFGWLTLRYRNAGSATPTLVISADTDGGNAEIGRVDLPPVPVDAESEFTTINVGVTPLAGNVTLELRYDGAADAVGLDALLFGKDKTPPLVVAEDLTPKNEDEGGGGAGGVWLIGVLLGVRLSRRSRRWR